MNGYTFYHNGKDYFFVTDQSRLTNKMVTAMMAHLGVYPASDKECALCRQALGIYPATLETCNGYYKISGARNHEFGITGYPDDTVIVNLEA